MMKKLLAAFLVILMIISMTISVYAQFYYETHSRITLTLTFTPSGASCYAKIIGDSDVIGIENAVLTLTDGKGNVKQWNPVSTGSSSLTMQKTYKDITEGETYTLTITATVKTSTSSETITDSITKKY